MIFSRFSSLLFLNIKRSLSKTLTWKTVGDMQSFKECQTFNLFVFLQALVRQWRLRGAAFKTELLEPMSWRAALQITTPSRPPSPEQLRQISARTSLVAATAKNPHPLTVTGVTRAAGPDKVLPILFDLPSLFLPGLLSAFHPNHPSHCPLPLFIRLFAGGREGLFHANWSVGFRWPRGWQHNHTSYQTEPTLIQRWRNSQLSLGS